ncbi:hypothetical protein I6N90_14240 [Paenibacillus sp. GSMTC-2017]|uniref:hypothetical protein n=1 Tax=Paenibacillus sp. GSMTC-2017 TaxID=2794350 RepID=UPI0018D93737|nr:hypothetical protein [Paenibacillus sp. GSMTC-2017]MBH5318961.1 hypothetical protein [Paenibacillus sp. GSMTC-2017]
MKRLVIMIVLIIVTLLISSCNKVSEQKWFETIDETIQKGLTDSDSIEIQRLSIENEIIVLFKLNDADAVGIGSVTVSDKGYSWYPGIHPFNASFLQLDYQTESKKVISLTIGKVRDVTIKEVILEGKLNNYELKVVKGYYIGTNIEPFYMYKSLP